MFRQVAAGTGSRFVFLSYGAGRRGDRRESDITSTDYRSWRSTTWWSGWWAEELAALSGGEPAPQPTSSPSPPTPPDQ